MDARVVIVTGGTFGIGAGISVELARRGWRVVAFGLDAAQLSSIAQDGTKALQQELGTQNLDADVLEADVSKSADVARVVDHAVGRYGRIDALVNNAAIGPLGNVLQTTEEVWDRVIAVNLKGVYLCCKAVLPHMITRGGGAIVNVGSGAGWGKPNMAAYAASKGGVHALSMALAYDHFQEHIRVNTVIPGGGGIITGMSSGVLAAMRKSLPRARPRERSPGAAPRPRTSPKRWRFSCLTRPRSFRERCSTSAA